MENISKTAQAGAYSATVLKQYEQLLVDRVNAATAVADAQKAADAAKQKMLKNGQAIQDNQQTILTDSLLYAGILTVNPTGSGIFSPNHPYYHYMRTHNALTDLQQFELKAKLDINETQHMDVFVINADPKSKYALVTTFAAPPMEMDPISADFTKLTAGAGTGDKKDSTKKPPVVTIEDVYNAYSFLLHRLSAFQNGIVSTPLQEIQDKTPDLVTMQVAHSGPAEAPKVVSYQINDPATGKNLNSENTVFSYRFNKLYRFRFKAGVAFSWLERRTYTINTTSNTATYTSTYTGLAPTLGVQVFLNRIDIQKPTLFPGSLYPFLYVGYMFNDAPINNFLLGGGFEVFSGLAIAGGVHLGKTQGLTVENGMLETKDRYQARPFISVNIGLEAFKAIFNTAKPATNIFTK